MNNMQANSGCEKNADRENPPQVTSGESETPFCCGPWAGWLGLSAQLECTQQDRVEVGLFSCGSCCAAGCCVCCCVFLQGTYVFFFIKARMGRLAILVCCAARVAFPERTWRTRAVYECCVASFPVWRAIFALTRLSRSSGLHMFCVVLVCVSGQGPISPWPTCTWASLSCRLCRTKKCHSAGVDCVDMMI